MGTLAHVFEAEGLATVSISLIRGQIENVKPPRALHCNFPLGRPLGKPGDAAFQRQVIEAAFALLKAPSGPVLEDFPEAIDDAFAQPLACTIPPRSDDSVPESVNEAKALRAAFDKNLAESGRTMIGRVIGADEIPDAVAAFVRVADGTPWKEANLPGHPLQVSKDILAYYEEAAAALSETVPAARAAESWFFQKTETGKMMKRAREALDKAGEKFSFYLIPFTQGLG